jgi:hypothetical protein
MRNHGSLFWGIVLVMLAGLLLLDQVGLITGSIFNYFWPLLIIALGIWMILGVVSRQNETAGEKVSIPLEGASSAYLKLDHAAGRLMVHSGAAAGEVLHGTFGNGLSYKSTRLEDRLDVKLRTSGNFWAWWPGDSLDWDISLPGDLPLGLKLDSGASATVLDLHDLKVTILDIVTGASSTQITLPEQAGDMRVDINAGASSLTLTIPPQVAARIKVKSGVASVDVDRRFAPLARSLYQSADYDQAANRADISIDTGVGSIVIK